LARIAAGGRVVRIPISGALTVGTKKPHTNVDTQTTVHGTSAAITHSGSVARTMPKQASRSGATKSSTRTTRTEPMIAPTPKAVKT